MTFRDLQEIEGREHPEVEGRCRRRRSSLIVIIAIIPTAEGRCRRSRTDLCVSPPLQLELLVSLSLARADT